MYDSKPSIVYGFHGLDKDIAFQIVNQEKELIHSNNDYDWLGYGVYFWENNLERAIKYAQEASTRKNSTIKTPFALGAVIELGRCLDLLDQKNNDFLQQSYELFKMDMQLAGKSLPSNKPFSLGDNDFKNRRLDCAVIRYACRLAKDKGTQFDSVRAAFLEGKPLYPGAKFFSENHIQLAVINPNCIKGIFLPRPKIEWEFPSFYGGGA